MIRKTVLIVCIITLSLSLASCADLRVLPAETAVETAAEAAAAPAGALTPFPSPSDIGMICMNAYYIEPDAPDELFFRYDPGAAVVINYTIYNPTETAAGKYSITYSGDNATLLSPDEYCAGEPPASHGLQFRVPESGEGEIGITLTAYFSNGNVYDHSTRSLYWSSCGCGVFVSGYSARHAKLAMSKAQFDAGEISSRDYYDIIQPPKNTAYDDSELARLINMLAQVCSDSIEYSHYAAPYVEAIHNHIFGIEPDAELPDINDTLDRIKKDLGPG